MDRTRTASTSSTTTTARGAPAAAPAQAQSRLRPNFSTLQTHYSPAKSRDPKPLTATYLAPPSPSKLPANVAASAETSKLQTELLQLHLLHRDAATVEAQWRASAKQKLGARFEKACITAEQVAEQEKAGLERANVLALHAWGSEGGLEEKIQGLDTVFNGIWSLSEPGGRYARMARRFERWMDQVSEVEQARRDGTYLEQGDQSLFISDLETPWKEDCAGTLRRLDGWRHQLRVLGEPPADEDGTSSLAKMLQGARSLVQDMLAEVQMMEEMEEEALAREAEWIEKMNRMDDDDTPQAGAIWRTV
ncbi:uncharacterized protein F5Z01DRAFT_653508 [Emericellopsis atlantica]|uniref:AGA1 A-agglutinin anchor subunit n=1 Tax=Emericellopsis atlantica TaxID=2614577 RepID=A0A9P7ZNI2_9HYPO|nr:uncharacterized protein F5Z01DRAFT_653508 [Emericellopsis atlantica]KAG9254972.1 hypothetical protein F5Z01DRAFT_653508 [Emericellopsis atlantica]